MASKFTITAELNLQTKNLNQVIGNLKQQFQGADFNVKIKDLDKAAGNIRDITKAAKTASVATNSLGNSIATAAKRFSAITLATGTLVGFTRAVKNAVSDAIEFEREVVKIAQATGSTVQQLKGLTREITSVATNFGVSSKELILAARNLTQAGFAADKVTGALKVLAQTELAATFDSIADTTEGAIALLNQFGKTAQKTGNEVAFLEKSFSAINQVSKEFAVESSDLVTAIRTTGSAFESAGGSLNELLALFTSVRSTTRESAESIATGFRTIFTRTQRLDTINNLRSLGVELQDVEGKFVGPMEAVKRLSAALNTIDPRDFRFNLIVEELGGFRQVSKVIPLIQQFAVTQKALNVAQNSSGSLAKDAATAQQSLAVQIGKTREKFSAFIRDLTESSTFQSTVKTLLSMAEAFLRVGEAIKPIIPLIAGFAAFKIGSSLTSSFIGMGGLPKRRNQGGPIGFARGGLVPGSGNGDTVPAMLTPGEFVIKKSSVKKLGANRLAGINGYADGGYVIRPKAGKFAGFFMQPEGVNDTSITSPGQAVTNEATKDALLNEVNKNYKKYKGGKLDQKQIDRISAEAINDYQPSVKTISSAISNNIFSKEQFDNFLTGNQKSQNLLPEKYDPAARGLDITSFSAAKITSLLDSEKDKYNKFVQSKVTQATPQGLSSLSKGTGVKIAAEGGDVPAFYIGDNDGPRSEAMRQAISKQTKEGFQKILSGIGNDSAFKGIGVPPLDITSESIKNAVEPLFNENDPKSARVTIEGYILEGITSALTGIKLGGSDATWDFPNVGSSAERLGKLFGNTSRIAEVISGDAKRSNNEGAKNSILTKKIASTLSKHPEYIGNVSKFASGGLANGSDTVPAMLTPGEFVLNKKSAQKIGYSALNRMNKVGKYANGGVVQGFAVGGGVDKAFLTRAGYTGSNVGPQTQAQQQLNNEILKTAKALQILKNAGIEVSSISKYLVGEIKNQGQAYKFTAEEAKKFAAMTKLSREIQKSQKAIASKDENQAAYKKIFDEASSKTKQLSSSFVLATGAISSVTAQMSGLDKKIADSVSTFAATFSAFYSIGQEFIDIGESIIAESRSRKIAEQGVKMHQNAIKRNKEALDQLTNEFIKQKNKISGKGAEVGSKDKGMEQAKKEAGTFSKVMGAANSALIGFSLAMAAGQAAISYYSEAANQSADKLSKVTDKLKEGAAGTNKDTLQKSTLKAFSDAAYSSILQKRLNSTETMAKLGGAAMLGAAAQGIPGVGQGAGNALAVAGAGAVLKVEFDKANAEYEAAVKDITSISNNFSDSLFTSISSLKEYNQFIVDIEKKTRSQVVSSAEKLSSGYAKSTEGLVNAQIKTIKIFGSLDKAPEQLKQNFESLRVSISELNKAIDNLIANLISRTAKDIQNLTDLGESTKDLFKKATQEFQTINNPRARAGLQAEFGPRIEQELRNRAEAQAPRGSTPEQIQKIYEKLAKDVGVKFNNQLKELGDQKIEIDTLTFQKQFAELEKQALLNTRAALLEKEAREKVIGTLSQELALRIVIENLSQSFDRINQKLGTFDAAMSGTVTGLQSSIPDIKVFDLLKPTGENLKDFNKALAIIGNKGGNIGQTLAGNIRDSKQAAANLESVLSGFGNINPEDVNKIIEKTLGAGNAGGNVGTALKKILMEGIKPKEGDTAAGRLINTEEGRKKVIEQFKEFASKLSETGKGFLKALGDLEEQQAAIYQKINESQQRQLELSLEDVDSYERYLSAVAKARGRELSLADKNALRFEKQARMVGGLAGNIDAIGGTLLQARRGLMGGAGGDKGQQASLAQTANRTEQALKQLANQSERTADTLSEIEKIKAQRENVRDLAKQFAIGTSEQRAQIQKDIQGALQVSQSGTFDTLAEDARSGADAILERFKDLPIFQGQTGRQVQNRAIANSVRAAGGNEEIARMIEADTSSPEEKLIDELRTIYEEEAKAKQYLSEQENVLQQALITSLQENAAETARLSDQLAQEFANAQANAGVGGNKGGPTVEEIDAKILALEDTILELDGTLWSLTESFNENITALNNVLNTQPLTGLQSLIKDLEGLVKSVKDAMDGVIKNIQDAISSAMDYLVKGITNAVDKITAYITGKLFGDKAESSGVKPDAGFKPNAGVGGNWKPPMAGMGAPMGRANGGLIYRAKGGSIFQPKGTDTVPAMLTPGEFVIRKSAVDKIGVDNLQAINGYAGGGKVPGIGQTAPGAAGVYSIGSSNLGGFGGFGKYSPLNLGGMGMGGGSAPVMPAVQYSSNYINPMQFYDMSLGAQQRQYQAQANYATNAVVSNAFSKASAIKSRGGPGMAWNPYRGSTRRPLNSQMLARKRAAARTAKNTEIANFGQSNSLLAHGLEYFNPNSIIYRHMSDAGVELWNTSSLGGSPLVGLGGTRSEPSISITGLPNITGAWVDPISGDTIDPYKDNPDFNGFTSWNMQQGSFWVPGMTHRSNGGLISYLAKGGQPSGVYSIGGYRDMASMVPKSNKIAETSFGFNSFGANNFNSNPMIASGVPLVSYGGITDPFGTWNRAFVQDPMMMAQASMRMQGMFANKANRMAGMFRSGYRPKPIAGGGYTHGSNPFRRARPGQEARGGGSIPGFVGPPSPFGGRGYASGGHVDSVPAMLTPGEFVMSKEAVGKHGMAFMNHLNRGGKIQGFAQGGPVYREAGGGVPGGGGGTDFGAVANMMTGSMRSALSSLGNIVNFDALNNLSSKFSNLVSTLGNIAGTMNGMNMNHSVNIDGQVNIGGMNAKFIAESIKQEVVNLVIGEVQRVMSQAQNSARNIDPMG